MEEDNMKKIGQLLERVPRPLLDSIVRGEVIPFIGSGFSKNCEGPDGFEMPNWKELGEAVAKELPDCGNDVSPLEVLSIYEDQYRRVPLVELMRRICRVSEIMPGEAHRLLCGCFSEIVCTTNFDFLIENAFLKERLAPLVVTAESSLSISNAKGATIVKIHGDFNDPDRMVVTERDYDLFVSRNPLLCTYVSNLFITRTMLLLGYSFEDCDMRQLLQIVQNRLGRMSRPIYSIQVDARADEVARFRRRGVEVINLSAGRRTYKETVTEFLRQLKAYRDGEALKHVTSNVDESKAQLILPGNENLLCFVSCSIKRVALLKRMLDPIIRRNGAIPLWPDNIVPTDGMSWKNAVEAAIRKSSVRIFDVTEAGGNILFELQMSLQDDESRTIIIRDASVADERMICLNDFQVINYSSDSIGQESEEMGRGVAEIERVLAGALGQRKRNQAGEFLEEPKRLFSQGAYNAAIVFAWTEIEAALRELRGMGDDHLCPVTKLLMEVCGGDAKLRDEMFRLRHFRNRIVHGMTVKVSKKDAAASLETARRLMQRISSRC